MYIVIEIQRQNEQTATIVTTHDTIEEAKQKFYTILSAAAVSSIQVHGASIILAHSGESIQHEVFDRTNYGI